MFCKVQLIKKWNFVLERIGCLFNLEVALVFKMKNISKYLRKSLFFGRNFYKLQCYINVNVRLTYIGNKSNSFFVLVLVYGQRSLERLLHDQSLYIRPLFFQTRARLKKPSRLNFIRRIQNKNLEKKLAFFRTFMIDKAVCDSEHCQNLCFPNVSIRLLNN